MDYPILSDPDTKVATAYGILIPGRKMAKRVTFFIDKEGKISKIDSEVKAATHAADVISQLKKLSAGDK